ncbi:MAG: hypothetical protein JRG85_08120 [Deltaproteobacteria bacterium]|nr:hypothetical protein [Deltaproteobacteria bacterium]
MLFPSGGRVAAALAFFTFLVLWLPAPAARAITSVDFDQFLFIFRFTYPDPAERPLTISLAQMLWNRGEASGHANHLTADTYADTPPKKILLHVAFADFQVADVTAEVEARSIGASIHRPGFDPAAYIAQNPASEPRPFFQVNPYYGIPAIPTSPPAVPIPDAPGATYDWDGSALVIWDSGNLQAPITNVPPPRPGNPELSACALDHREDPHECPRRQPSAPVQKSHFLSTGGSVVDVCAGQTCLAPLP